MTNMHVTRRQATGLLKCVRNTQLNRRVLLTLGDLYSPERLVEHLEDVPSEEELRGLESMLTAALERIRDKERVR